MRIAVAVVLAVASTGASAYSGTFTAPNGVVHSGTYYVAPGSAWSGGKTNLVGTVAGLAAGATLNASGSAAYNAASVIAMAAFAAGGPVGLGVGVLAWLSAQGISYSDALHHDDGTTGPGWSKSVTLTGRVGEACSINIAPEVCGSPMDAAKAMVDHDTIANAGHVVYSNLTIGACTDTSCAWTVDRLINGYERDTAQGIVVVKHISQTTYKTRPATEEDFSEAQPQVQLDPTKPDLDTTLFDQALKDSPVPVPVDLPAIDAFSPDGLPYPCTTQASKECQDGFTVKTDPGNPPAGVVVTPVTRDATDKTGTPADPTTGTGDSTDEPDKTDLCKLHPTSVACTELGTPPDENPTWQTKDVTYTVDDLGLPAACPAAYSFTVHGWALGFDYGPVCSAAPTINAALTILAAIGCALFIMKTVKT